MESTALVPLAETMQLGEVLARSGFFKDGRDASQAVVKVLAGRELGIGPVASMTGIYIVEGKVSIGANLMAAAVKRSGKYNYRVTQMDATACSIDFYEKGEKIGVSTFTMQDAQAAGVASKQVWKAYPRNMLFSRALSNGVRWFCPDIFGGAPVYDPEELGATVNGETGEIIDVTPQPVQAPPVATAAGNGNTGKSAPPAHVPEEGEHIWADWRNPSDAKAWASTQGKFNHEQHLENAYNKVKTDCKPRTAQDMWRCWYKYVTEHEPAKPAAILTDAELDGVEEKPQF